MTERLVLIEQFVTRGPGGHINSYRAFFTGDEVGPVGYGATKIEATRSLRSLLKANEEQKKTPPKSTDQYGWFVWTRKNGVVSYHKYIIEGDRIHADTKKYYEGFEVKKFPINKAEWDRPLDTLAAQFPLPEEFKLSTDHTLAGVAHAK